MRTETTYTCNFCKKILDPGEIKWVEVTHRPPEWDFRGRKCESYEFCKKCYKEFLSILRKRSSNGICGICIYAYCCNESEDSNCDYIKEPNYKRKWWKFWRPK